MKPAKTSIVLVDDHIVVRNGLAELIEVLGDYKVSAQYSNGQELLDAIPFPNHEMPDLILLDLTMPVLDGEQTMVRLKELNCTIPVLILTLNVNEATILRLYRLGVRGYLAKDCTAGGLREAIDAVLASGYHHSDILYKALMADEPKPDTRQQQRENILKKLSARELDFLRLVCNEKEYTYEQIAGTMHVSRRTVDGYREAIFEKFDIKSKTGLVLFCIKYQLLEIQ